MKSTKDVIKKSVLEGFVQGDMGIVPIIVTLAVTALLAVYIYAIYRLTTRNSFYNRDFNKTLGIMPIITAAIVLAMQSSIVISLGMVGALSIVRFRNAVKDPMDLVYLFWSIGIGIICGARLYEIAIITSLAVTIVMFLLDLVPAMTPPYLLVLNSSDRELEPQLNALLKSYTRSARIKSRNFTAQGLDMIVEVRTKKEAQLVSACAALPGVESVNLLAHDGEARF